MKTENLIKIKNKEEVDILRQAGHILASIIKELKRSLKSGITTKDIDTKAEVLINDYHVKPAFKGYRGFPACVCTSINEEVVHGIPGNKVINDGDIVSVDVGIIYKNYYSDTAFTAGIGKITQPLERLIKITEQALYKGIEKARAGNHLTDISHTIQAFVEDHNLSVVREFVGHGIGQALHEDPEVPNFGEPHCGPILKDGMVIAIEPMVNLGTWETRVLNDGWTVVSADSQPSAHFEHCIAITDKDPLILTQ
jgi:methionyl aminopeptidase